MSRLSALLVLVLLAVAGALIYNVVSDQTQSAPVVHVTFPAGQVNNHPDTLPVTERVPRWVRINTPAGYPLIMRACLGPDGVYVGQEGSVSVVPSDPECKTPDP